MRITLLTNEYPPNVYGGAGVHVEYLARELARLEAEHRVEVLCFGDQQVDDGNLRVRGVLPGAPIPGFSGPCAGLRDSGSCQP